MQLNGKIKVGCYSINYYFCKGATLLTITTGKGANDFWVILSFLIKGANENLRKLTRGAKNFWRKNENFQKV